MGSSKESPLIGSFSGSVSPLGSGLSISGLATTDSSTTGVSTFGDSGVLLPFVIGSVTGVSGVFSSMGSAEGFTSSATSLTGDSGVVSPVYKIKNIFIKFSITLNCIENYIHRH